LIGHKSFKVEHCCRLCMARRKHIWNFAEIPDINLRCCEETNILTKGAFQAYCRKMRKLPLTRTQNYRLERLEKLGIQPLDITLLNFEKPSQNFTSYLYAPADLLHTLLSGACRDWIVYNGVICKQLH
jgi:hypothetical protein